MNNIPKPKPEIDITNIISHCNSILYDIQGYKSENPANIKFIYESFMKAIYGDNILKWIKDNVD